MMANTMSARPMGIEFMDGDDTASSSAESLRDIHNQLRILANEKSIVRGKVPSVLNLHSSLNPFRSDDDVVDYLDDIYDSLEKATDQREKMLLLKARNIVGDYLGENQRSDRDDKYASELLKSDRDNGGATAKEWRRLFYNDPDMIEAWRSSLIDDLLSTINGERGSKKSFERWYQAHKGGLKSFPETDRELYSPKTRSQAIQDRAQQLYRREIKDEDQELINELTSTPFKKIKGFPKTDGSKAKQISALLRHNPRAMAAARRSVWDESAFSLDGPAAFQKYLNDREPVLTEFIGKQHLQDLKTVADRAARNGLGRGGSVTPGVMPHYKRGGFVPMHPSLTMPMSAPGLNVATLEAMYRPEIARALAAQDYRALMRHLVKTGHEIVEFEG